MKIVGVDVRSAGLVSLRFHFRLFQRGILHGVHFRGAGIFLGQGVFHVSTRRGREMFLCQLRSWKSSHGKSERFPSLAELRGMASSLGGFNKTNACKPSSVVIRRNGLYRWLVPPMECYTRHWKIVFRDRYKTLFASFDGNLNGRMVAAAPNIQLNPLHSHAR